MSFTRVSAGKHVPQEVNVIIEIPQDGGPVKYEVDKTIDMLVVDRFLGTSMRYPANYGYVPQTLSEDGDPVDVLVLTPYPLQVGSMVRARPIGMLRMTDESGVDAKILAVPIDKLCPHYHHVHKPEDVGLHTLHRIEHFFTHYKDLEQGKWVKIDGWGDVDAAYQEILASVKRYIK